MGLRDMKESTILEAVETAVKPVEELFYSAGYEISYKVYSGYFPSLIFNTRDPQLPTIRSHTSLVPKKQVYKFDLEVEFDAIDTRELDSPEDLIELTRRWQAVLEAVEALMNIRVDMSKYE